MRIVSLVFLFIISATITFYSISRSNRQNSTTGVKYTFAYESPIGCPHTERAGLWTDEHKFPRLAAVNASYSSSKQTDVNLDQLSAYHLVLSGTYMPDWTETSFLKSVNNYATFLRDRNPHIKLVAFLHAYGFYNPNQLGGARTFPDVHAISQALFTAGGLRPGNTDAKNGWWLVNPNGTVISPWGTSGAHQALINWSSVDPSNPNDTFAQWMADYTVNTIMTKTSEPGKPYWDGFGMETDTNYPHHISGPEWDLDENGIADNAEQSPVPKGKRWMDEQQTIGFETVYRRVLENANGRKIVAGGELWGPGLNGIESVSNTWNSANMAIVIFLNSDYYDASCTNNPSLYWSGNACLTRPPGGKEKLWDFHMRQAIKFMSFSSDRIYIFKPLEANEISSDSYFSPYFTGPQSYEKYARFLLGSAYLVNAYAQPKSGDNLPVQWCDECGVNSSGASVWNPDRTTTSWMGCPYADAKTVDTNETFLELLSKGKQWELSSHVWIREFTNALLIVNPTQNNQTIPISSGWRYISGKFDPNHNVGYGTSTVVTLNPMDALFLVRRTAPTPNIAPTIPSTPTPTSTIPTPTLPKRGTAPTNTPRPTNTQSANTNTPVPQTPTLTTNPSSILGVFGNQDTVCSDHYPYPFSYFFCKNSSLDISISFPMYLMLSIIAITIWHFGFGKHTTWDLVWMIIYFALGGVGGWYMNSYLFSFIIAFFLTIFFR